MKTTKQELIDLLKSFYNYHLMNYHKYYSMDRMIDKYLESINSASNEGLSVTENEGKKEFIGCTCKEEDKHGWTTIQCCNECGKPIESFWVHQ